jgi:hypothetical protein
MNSSKKLLILALLVLLTAGLMALFTLMGNGEVEAGEFSSNNPDYLRMREAILKLGQADWNESQYNSIKFEISQLHGSEFPQINSEEETSLSTLLKSNYFTVLSKEVERFCKSASPGDSKYSERVRELEEEFESSYQPEKRSGLINALSLLSASGSLLSRTESYVENSAYSSGQTGSLLRTAQGILSEPLLKSNGAVQSTASRAKILLDAHQALGEGIEKLKKEGNMRFCSSAINSNPKLNSTFSYYVKLCASSNN